MRKNKPFNRCSVYIKTLGHKCDNNLLVCYFNGNAFWKTVIAAVFTCLLNGWNYFQFIANTFQVKWFAIFGFRLIVDLKIKKISRKSSFWFFALGVNKFRINWSFMGERYSIFCQNFPLIRRTKGMSPTDTTPQPLCFWSHQTKCRCV